MSESNSTKAPAIPALLTRYMKRRDLSGRELARRVDRSHTAVQNLLSPTGKGTKGWQGDAILYLVAYWIIGDAIFAGILFAAHFSLNTKER